MHLQSSHLAPTVPDMWRPGLLLAFVACVPGSGTDTTEVDLETMSTTAVTSTNPPVQTGTGETVDRLEEFRPEGLASRILGMGDIVGLVKDFEEVIDEKEAQADAARLLKGSFGLDDLLKQMRMIQKLGPLKDVFSKLPGIGQLAGQVDEGELVKVESMIQSMTRSERAKPSLIDKSRARRIATGSGHKVSEVEQLVDRFMQMRQLMGALGQQGGLLARMGGGLPGAGGPAFGGGPSLGGRGGLPSMGMGFDPSMLLGGPGRGGAPRKPQDTKAKKNKRKQQRDSRKKHRKK